MKEMEVKGRNKEQEAQFVGLFDALKLSEW